MWSLPGQLLRSQLHLGHKHFSLAPTLPAPWPRETGPITSSHHTGQPPCYSGTFHPRALALPAPSVLPDIKGPGFSPLGCPCRVARPDVPPAPGLRLCLLLPPGLVSLPDGGNGGCKRAVSPEPKTGSGITWLWGEGRGSTGDATAGGRRDLLEGPQRDKAASE